MEIVAHTVRDKAAMPGGIHGLHHALPAKITRLIIREGNQPDIQVNKFVQHMLAFGYITLAKAVPSESDLFNNASSSFSR